MFEVYLGSVFLIKFSNSWINCHFIHKDFIQKSSCNFVKNRPLQNFQSIIVFKSLANHPVSKHALQHVLIPILIAYKLLHNQLNVIFEIWKIVLLFMHLDKIFGASYSLRSWYNRLNIPFKCPEKKVLI